MNSSKSSRKMTVDSSHFLLFWFMLLNLDLYCLYYSPLWCYFLWIVTKILAFFKYFDPYFFFFSISLFIYYDLFYFFIFISFIILWFKPLKLAFICVLLFWSGYFYNEGGHFLHQMTYQLLWKELLAKVVGTQTFFNGLKCMQ